MSEKETIELDDFFEIEIGNKEALPIDSDGLEELIEKVISKTGLEEEVAKTIVIRFFQEIRNSLLDGDKIVLNNFGGFYISTHLVYPRFKASKVFHKKLNKK